jgi:hypothetical protein
VFYFIAHVAPTFLHLVSQHKTTKHPIYVTHEKQAHKRIEPSPHQQLMHQWN